VRAGGLQLPHFVFHVLHVEARDVHFEAAFPGVDQRLDCLSQDLAVPGSDDGVARVLVGTGPNLKDQLGVA